jgi:hypothetical protein
VLARYAETTVLADLFFAKIWLARRFTAPSCLPVCCDGNRALPFARGVFDLAMCTDALMYLWEKRPFIGELARAVDGNPRGTVLINHTHNQMVWNPSQGDALTPDGYRRLFETMTPRVFGESSLFSDVVAGETLDLTRVDGDDTLDQEAALTLIASPVAGVFALHAIAPPAPTGGDWCVNPLYRLTRDGAQVRAELTFPSEDYEYEYGSCRAYLPPSFTLTLDEHDALRAGHVPSTLASLVARRAIIEMPAGYL